MGIVVFRATCSTQLTRKKNFLRSTVEGIKIDGHNIKLQTNLLAELCIVLSSDDTVTVGSLSAYHSECMRVF